jgi:hypothetical protein
MEDEIHTLFVPLILNQTTTEFRIIQ